MATIDKDNIISELKVFGRNQSILIAEATPSIAKEKANMLLPFFAEAFVTTTTQKAIRRFKQHSYDIVIASLANTMQYNGLDVISEIKSINPEQIIIVLSYEFEESVILPLFELGVSSVLMVPYEEDDLLLKVMRMSEKIYFHNMLKYGSVCKIPREENSDNNTKKEKIVFRKPKAKPQETEDKKDKKPRVNVFNKRVDEEVSAKEFILFLEENSDISVAYLLDYMQELDQGFESVTNNFIANGINEDVINSLVEILYSYEDQLNRLIRFEVLAQAFGNLAQAIESADNSLISSKTFDLLSYINDDLAKFVKNVFEEQDVSNIHYLDDSLITSMEQIVVNLSPVDDDDDDDDLELF
jgi:DNA-binding response OmpR family regulator